MIGAREALVMVGRRHETHPKRAAEVGPLIAELKRCIEALEAEGRGTCGS